MKKSKIITITLILLFISLVIICNKSIKKPLIKLLGGYTEQINTVTIDTLEIQIDTTLLIDEWLSINADILEPTYIDSIVFDTIFLQGKIQYIKDTLTNIAKYENNVSDSLIDGTIITLFDFNNQKMLSQNLDYKPKFPIIITKTIPIVKTITNTIYNTNNIGVGAKVNTLGDVGVLGAYQSNQGWQFQGGYNFSKNTNYIEVGVIKFF